MIPVQPGDVADRYTILILKAQHGVDVDSELAEYAKEVIRSGIPQDMLRDLLAVNSQIWSLESDIRKGNKLSLTETGRRARKIRDFNRQRIHLKNEVTAKLGGHKEIKVDHGSQ